MSSGATAQDTTWKNREQGEEARYIRKKAVSNEQAQLEAIRDQLKADEESEAKRQAKDFEAGYGGQEDLEDRYATTSGEH